MKGERPGTVLAVLLAAYVLLAARAAWPCGRESVVVMALPREADAWVVAAADVVVVEDRARGLGRRPCDLGGSNFVAVSVVVLRTFNRPILSFLLTLTQCCLF